MSCPYCDSPEIQERTVENNNLAFAFLTNIPIVPGHTLVSPKRHVAKYDDLTEKEMQAIESLRVKTSAALTKTFGATGFNFAWNDGETAGQSVPHFHLHIVPRKKGDAGVHEYDPRKLLYRPGPRNKKPEDELSNIAKLIKKNH